MKLIPTIINQTYQSKKVLVTISADNESDALSYFKGRFDKTGHLVKTLGKNNFIVTEK